MDSAAPLPQPPSPAPQATADDDATRVVVSGGTPAAAAPATPVTPFGAKPALEPQALQLGRYRLLGRLGEGGMATVFKAYDPDISRAAAIKFLHPSLALDAEYRARFLAEARAAGGLSHPNIVTVYDVGEIDGRPYIAMEMIEGHSLAEDLTGGAQLPIREVATMGMQLARALAFAHERGIVHRDIKPGNIMRIKDTHTIKVTDFGIAHTESSTSLQRTQVGAVLGTPHYMSPEQANGERLDGRSDLFSAGIVLYLMLTGKRPFQGDNPVTLAMRITNDEPEPIQALRPEVPASLRRVIARCMAKRPERRFASGAELAQALAKVVRELDEQEADGTGHRIVPLRVKWALLMSLVVAAVMGITATVITSRQNTALTRQATDYGASMARFIAKLSAVSALAEDWVAVEVAIQAMMKEGDVQSITVIDRAGVVRAASAGPTGKPYEPPKGKALDSLPGEVGVVRYTIGKEPVLGFEAPITFQDKGVGRVALGVPERPLLAVIRLSITLMVILVLVTVAAVAIAMYFLADRFARPVRLVIESMQEIGKGRFDHRIKEHRNDEFGQLYAGFDEMAEALGARQQAPAVAENTAHKA